MVRTGQSCLNNSISGMCYTTRFVHQPGLGYFQSHKFIDKRSADVQSASEGGNKGHRTDNENNNFHFTTILLENMMLGIELVITEFLVPIPVFYK